MNRFVTLILLLSPISLYAQITWITDCSDKNFCLKAGSCTEGNVFMVEKAATACVNSSIVNYNYKIDLFNDGSTDISSTQDTVSGPFPVGTHKVSWRATDNCANIANCTYLFTIKDCQAPNLICINSLTQNVTPGCVVTFKTGDFILNFSDNCTPNDELVFGIQLEGEGDDFPTESSLSFDGCDFGPHSVEIWVKDENNLVNKCFSSLGIQDNDDVCGCAFHIGLQGCARTADSAKLNNYTMRAELASSSMPAGLFVQQNVLDSCFYRTLNDLPTGGDYEVVVQANRKDDPLDNVTTFDLLQTSKHILNIQPFQSVYQRLAADVNASNSVTTFDVVETRKLILGLYDTFPKVPAWRFVRPVADPTNLLSAVKDTYRIILHNLSADTIVKGLDFVGVKMGDTNLSAFFTSDQVDDRAPLLLSVEDRLLAAGTSVSIPVRLNEAAVLDGWQLAFSADPSLALIEGVDGLHEGDYALAKNGLRALWFDAGGRKYSAGEALFYLKIRALQPVAFSEALSLATQKLVPEAYVRVGNGPEERHAFVLGFGVRQENSTAFFPPCPNPFGSETAFGFLLRQPGEIHLEVFDLSGTKVFEQKMASGAGHQSLVLQSADLPGSGVYCYRVRMEGEVFSGRLVRG